MNHRSLLVRFIAHLIDSQGTCYVDADTVGANIQFTPEEKAELATLSREARVVLRR
jgi:hypothetical protein